MIYMYLYRSLQRSSVIQGAYALVNISATNAIADGNGVRQTQGYPNGSDHQMMQGRVKMEGLLENRLRTSTRENKDRKPLPLPPPLSSHAHHDHMAQRSDSGDRMMHSSLATSQTLNTNTDHLYDTLDTPVDFDSPFYHTIDAKCSSSKASDSPSEGHIYHVLEGPPSVPVAATASKYPSNTTNPPHPLPQRSAIVNRPRLNTCITNTRVTQGNNTSTGFQRSRSTSYKVPVSEQLSSVMSIYAVVPEDKSQSVLLPPKQIKPPVMPRRKEEPGKAEEVHIYHVLEVGSPNECQTGDTKQLLKKQQQTNNWKLKENSDSVSQMVRTESNGICNGPTESCESESVNMKPVVKMEEESEYAMPNTPHQETKETPAHPQFDDPSYFSQPSATNKHLPPTTLSKTVKQPALDDSLYATPTTGGYTQPLFDDPQYDCSQAGTPVQPERPTQTSIEFDDPKYQAPLSQILSDAAAGTKSKRSPAHHHTTIPTSLFDDPKYASGFLPKNSEAKSGSMDSLKSDHLLRVHVRPRSNSLFDDSKYASPESKILLKQTLL